MSIKPPFKELVCEIADPYTPITEDELKYFIRDNKKNWDVIYSSGIIRKEPKDLQNEFHFKEEFQDFIEEFISRLYSFFHDNQICKADVYCLEKIEEEIKKTLNDISDFKSKENQFGYVINQEKRVIELHLFGQSLEIIPNGVFKLIELKKLNLTQNHIIQIPEKVDRLRNLEEFIFENNWIIKIPKTMKALSKLNRVNLINNQIQKIPDWWNDFKNLKYVNISNNKFKKGNPNKDLHSIDNVLDDSGLVDDKLIYFQKIGKDFISLNLKDAVIIDYVENLKHHHKIEFRPEFENSSIKKIEIVNSTDLKSLFWSSKSLDSLTLKIKAINFKINYSIKNLIIDSNTPNQEHTDLNLSESIDNLKCLECLYIKNYSNMVLPKSIEKCLNLNWIFIFSEKLNNYPILFNDLDGFKTIIINSILDLSNFENIKRKFIENKKLIFLRPSSGLIFREITINSDIKNFYLIHRHPLPSNIIIKGEVQTLLVIQQEHLNSRILEITENSILLREGIFFFNNNSFDFPNIEADLVKLENLYIDNKRLNTINNDLLSSGFIKKLLITNKNIKINPVDFLEEVFSGFFVIRVHSSYHEFNFTNKFKNLKHLRIDLDTLTRVPEFIRNLERITKVLITSIEMEKVTKLFSEEEKENIIEIRCNDRLNSFEPIVVLENLTHLHLQKLIFNNVPKSLEKLDKLKLIRITNCNLRSLPEFMISLKNFSQLHLNSTNQDLLIKEFWNYDKQSRLEFQYNHRDDFRIDNINNITHMRFSGHNNFGYDGELLRNSKITHLRLDYINRIPSFVSDLTKLTDLELDIDNIRKIPSLFSQFNQIHKILITDKSIDYDQSFWAEKSNNILKIRVTPQCSFPEFFKDFTKLSHIWIEIPRTDAIPNIFESFKKQGFSIKIYNNINSAPIELLTYFKFKSPHNIIIIVGDNCIIPEELKQYLVMK